MYNHLITKAVILGGIAVFALVPSNARAQAPSCQSDSRFAAADLSIPVPALRVEKNAAKPDAADTLKSFGVKTVIRYYDFIDETIPGKTLTPVELDHLLSKKLNVAVVFQHHNDDPETFLNPKRGVSDAEQSLALAAELGQPFDSTIYFGLDGADQHLKDVAYEYAIANGGRMSEAREKADQKVARFYRRFLKYQKKYFNKPVNQIRPEDMLPHFRRYISDIKTTFAAAAAKMGGAYEVGAYGSGMICEDLLAKNIVTKCWLSQSLGHPGSKDFREKKDANGRYPWVMSQQPVTKCVTWRDIRGNEDVVEFDYNLVNPVLASFGQWSHRAEVPAIYKKRRAPPVE